MEILDAIRNGFNNHVALRERRPGVVQVIAPLFHEDGDMVDIFIDLPKSANGPIRLSDHGMTLMRLSYTYEIDSPAKQKVFDKLVSENGISEDRGRLYLETTPDHLYPALLQFAQTITRVSNMQILKREVIHSLFYEELNEFVASQLSKFNPVEDYVPISDRLELQVDWKFGLSPKPIFLYGVRDNAKARFAALACREFQIKHIPFRSVIVHDDFESGLSKKDQAIITNVADKQFTSLVDFQQNAEMFFERESDRPSVQ
jgi:hypothetical protein